MFELNNFNDKIDYIIHKSKKRISHDFNNTKKEYIYYYDDLDDTIKEEKTKKKKIKKNHK